MSRQVAVLERPALSIVRPLVRSFRVHYHQWLSFPWLVALFSALIGQFWIGFQYNSNDTTNIYLQLARGSAYVLLLSICLLWLPVMRHGMAALWRSRLANWLPLEQAKSLHRWLGHLLFIGAIVHGSCYLLYYDTLDSPFVSTVLGEEPDLVRAMKTTMYEFVSDDESIEEIANWIVEDMPINKFESVVYPVMKEDCSKCHNTSSTMTYAIPTLPLSTYDEVVSLSHSGTQSRQFRINTTGIAMLLIVVILWLSSLAVVRHRYHHVFQHLHRLGYLIVILALLHIPRYNWLIIPSFVLVIELFFSHCFRVYRQRTARIEKVSDTFLRLEINRPMRFKLLSGHYLQLRIPSIEKFEWHDFSLTGVRENKDVIVLKIKVLGDWTDKLYKLVEPNNRAEVTVDIRGPFATPAAQTVQKQNCLLVAGGIGVTPYLSLLHDLKNGLVPKKEFHLVWVLRDSQLLQWLDELLSAKISNGYIYLFITRPIAEELCSKDIIEELRQKLEQSGNVGRVFIKKERPDWKVLLSQISQKTLLQHCFICAPQSMTKTVKKLCQSQGCPVSVEQF